MVAAPGRPALLRHPPVDAIVVIEVRSCVRWTRRGITGIGSIRNRQAVGYVQRERDQRARPGHGPNARLSILLSTGVRSPVFTGDSGTPGRSRKPVWAFPS